MALVMELTTPAGVKVEFWDDAYAGCSEAELERRRELARRTAWQIAIQVQKKKEREQHEDKSK